MGLDYLLILLLITVVQLVIAFVNNYSDITSYKRQMSHQHKIRGIYDIIGDCLAKTNATRMIVFRTHNGGGEPSLRKPFKISALYGSNIHQDTKYRYQNLLVDQAYTEMLLDIRHRHNNKGEVYQLVTEQESNSLLKRIYQDEGVKISNLYYLLTDGEGMLYCSISSDKVEEWDTDMDLVTFDFAVQSLRQVFQRDKDENTFWRKLFRSLGKLFNL